MTYNLFPAVDENFDFPVDVRVQLAKSEQLRNLVIPMTETARDNLNVEELWFGRTIYNTTTDTLESWKSPGAWVTYLDDTYSFPDPPPFWDENYDIPVEVRAQLAKSEELRNLVIPMTEVTRDALSSLERWNGRTIFNITARVLEVWISVESAWFKLLDETYTPPANEWQDWEPVLTHWPVTEAPQPANWSAEGRYLMDDRSFTVCFTIAFNGAISDSNATNRDLKIQIPPFDVYQSYYSYGNIGTVILDQTALPGGKRRSGVIETITYNGDLYVGMAYSSIENNKLESVTNKQPLLWSTDCTIVGQIMYEVKH